MVATPLVRPGSVVLDRPDPEALANFYAALLEWPAAKITHQGHWASLVDPEGGLAVEFQRVADHRPPTWPDPRRPRMFHLDLAVSELTRAAEHAVAMGAMALDLSDAHPTWQVYADPAGHPFCLCAC